MRRATAAILETPIPTTWIDCFTDGASGAHAVEECADPSILTQMCSQTCPVMIGNPPRRCGKPVVALPVMIRPMNVTGIIRGK